VTLGPPDPVPLRLQELRALGYNVDIRTELDGLDASVTVEKDGLRIQYMLTLWAFHEWLHGHDAEGHMVGTTGRPRTMHHHEYETHMRVIGISEGGNVPNEQLEAYRQIMEMPAIQYSRDTAWSSSKLEIYPIEDHQAESPSVNLPEVPRFKPGRIIDLD
jgi:hypothetical protein